MFGSKCWFLVTLKTDALKGHFWNGCAQGSFEARMRATRRAILTDARNGLLGNGCAQGVGQIPEARNVHPRCRQPLLPYHHWEKSMWWCGQVLHFWYHQVSAPIRSLRVCASDWISDPRVLWINFLKLIIYFFKMRLCWDGISCTRRCRIPVPSHYSPPLFWLFNFCLNVLTRLSRSGRLAVAWWMLIMLIRSPSCRIKPQNASMGHVIQHLFPSGFMPIHNKCFGAKHTFLQKGDYYDMRSSVIVSITWHLVTVRIYY